MLIQPWFIYINLKYVTNDLENAPVFNCVENLRFSIEERWIEKLKFSLYYWLQILKMLHN